MNMHVRMVLLLLRIMVCLVRLIHYAYAFLYVCVELSVSLSDTIRVFFFLFFCFFGTKGAQRYESWCRRLNINEEFTLAVLNINLLAQCDNGCGEFIRLPSPLKIVKIKLRR